MFHHQIDAIGIPMLLNFLRPQSHSGVKRATYPHLNGIVRISDKALAQATMETA